MHTMHNSQRTYTLLVTDDMVTSLQLELLHSAVATSGAAVLQADHSAQLAFSMAACVGLW